MRFIETSGAGGPEVMTLAEGPAPSPGAGEVLIEVAWAGVNRPDVLQRAGAYPPPPGASPILGLGVAGKVVKGAGPWKAGDEVCALVSGGGYAELCAAPAPQCLPVPKGMGLKEAAALPETFFTVWANLFGHGRLTAGETVLIHGGTSGIGVTAIQLAKAFGATVIATAGSAAKRKACLDLGADAAIDYRAQDFVAEVKRITDGKLVNVVLDMVGADYFNRNLKCLAMDGRLVIIAFLGGFEVAKADLRPVMTRRLTVTGSTMRPRTTAQKAELARALREKVWPLLDAGRCAPPIHKVFPLKDAAAAHALMETSTHIGKIMLKVAD
jgi:NADPH:quinone reductase